MRLNNRKLNPFDNTCAFYTVMYLVAAILSYAPSSRNLRSVSQIKLFSRAIRDAPFMCQTNKKEHAVVCFLSIRLVVKRVKIKCFNDKKLSLSLLLLLLPLSLYLRPATFLYFIATLRLNTLCRKTDFTISL